MPSYPISKVGRPRSSSSTPRQETSPLSPKVSTVASVRDAIADVSASSALRTAVPSAGSASTISPLAAAIASRLPNSPMWAVPTLITAATLGGAISQR